MPVWGVGGGPGAKRHRLKGRQGTLSNIDPTRRWPFVSLVLEALKSEPYVVVLAHSPSRRESHLTCDEKLVRTVIVVGS